MIESAKNIVWYRSINLPGYGRSEESLMRLERGEMITRENNGQFIDQ